MLILIIEVNLTDRGSFFTLYTLRGSSFLWWFAIATFSVKLPLYTLHSWLPKAHVEAPVFGSMVLAGILLKLGVYGIIRFIALNKFNLTNNAPLNALFYVGLLGGLAAATICVRQIDLKIMIAYSSVVHMRTAVLGIISFSN